MLKKELQLMVVHQLKTVHFIQPTMIYWVMAQNSNWIHWQNVFTKEMELKLV